jgi:hypothetical protein
VVLADNVGQRILLGKFLSEGLDHGKIPEGFDSSDDLTLFVSQNSRTDADRNFFAFFIDDRDGKVYDLVFSLNRLFERTPRKADIRPKDVVTILAQGFLLSISCNSLRRFIHKSNFAFIVYGKNAISNTIENNIKKFGLSHVVHDDMGRNRF